MKTIAWLLALAASAPALGAANDVYVANKNNGAGINFSTNNGAQNVVGGIDSTGAFNLGPTGGTNSTLQHTARGVWSIGAIPLNIGTGGSRVADITYNLVPTSTTVFAKNSADTAALLGISGGFEFYSDASTSTGTRTVGDANLVKTMFSTAAGLWTFGAANSTALHVLNGSLNDVMQPGNTLPASGSVVQGIAFANNCGGCVAPIITGMSVNNGGGLVVQGRTSNDTGSAPVLTLDASTNTYTAIATRPVLQVTTANQVTVLASVTGASAWTFGTAAFAGNHQVNGSMQIGATSNNRYSFFDGAGNNTVATFRSDDNSTTVTALTLQNRQAGGAWANNINFQFQNNGANGGPAQTGVQIQALQDQNWTSTASTQNATFKVSTSKSGALVEKFSVDSAGTVKISGAAGLGAASAYLYQLTNTASTTCTASCNTSTGRPAPANANSGACLMAWTSAGVPQGCGVTAANQFCLCTAIP